MKGLCKEYPNKGVRLDPRTITSVRIPESLRVYRGFLSSVLSHLVRKKYCTYYEIENKIDQIYDLEPFNVTNNKYKSSLFIYGEYYLIEIFRTSDTNYKAYALKIKF